MSKRTNMNRANEGIALCNKMQELTGVDEMADQISDIICTMMHTCRLIRDEYGDPIDFERELAHARTNFDAEVEEDDDE